MVASNSFGVSMLLQFSFLKNCSFLFLSLFVEQLSLKKGQGSPSAGGSHMSGVWGREKPRQAFPPQNLQRGCFEPATW